MSPFLLVAFGVGGAWIITSGVAKGLLDILKAPLAPGFGSGGKFGGAGKGAPGGGSPPAPDPVTPLQPPTTG